MSVTESLILARGRTDASTTEADIGYIYATQNTRLPDLAERAGRGPGNPVIFRDKRSQLCFESRCVRQVPATLRAKVCTSGMSSLPAMPSSTATASPLGMGVL